MARRKMPEKEIIQEETPIVESYSEPENKTGVVVDCDKLNVRVRPSTTAEISTTINRGDEVEIDVASIESASEFYKIFSKFGIEGYCMKQYISIK